MWPSLLLLLKTKNVKSMWYVWAVTQENFLVLNSQRWIPLWCSFKTPIRSETAAMVHNTVLIPFHTWTAAVRRDLQLWTAWSACWTPGTAPWWCSHLGTIYNHNRTGVSLVLMEFFANLLCSVRACFPRPENSLDSNYRVAVRQSVFAFWVGALFVHYDNVVCQIDAGPQQIIQAVRNMEHISNVSSLPPANSNNTKTTNRCPHSPVYGSYHPVNHREETNCFQETLFWSESNGK